MDPSSPKHPASRAVQQERGIISGDNVQFGRVKRRSRLSQSESSGPEEEIGSYGRSPVLQGLQAEQVWYNRSAYDHAEGNYHRQRTSSGNGPLSSSPRSPNVRSFHAKRNQNQDPNHSSPTMVRSSGTRQDNKGRNRTSSETESGARGSRGPAPRKRGFSETENKPKRDNTIMKGLQCLTADNIWFDKHRYDDAERRYYESLSGHVPQQQHQSSSHAAAGDQELISRMKSLEVENQSLHKVVYDLRAALLKLESRVAVLEKSPAVPCAKAGPVQAAPVQQKKVENGAKAASEDEDDDLDLFGSDEEDEEAERVKQERLDAYAAKKAKKPALIAKSSIILDVKPWDDETDMAKMEECVRSIQMDGLLWGASKLVPVGYGIKKLQINCVVEDDKVGTDILEEEITKFEDHVQSVDVAAFNKI
ncbi:eukaryotic translation elongation factor 1 delta a (guanine nucleotide exchange protein) isoform X3 [Periophthalmus magnuspinnatus]|uniref:eukaryotic translation elongation factor 1 delta a (guanine nucleotide exchange protein) isoform X3 n=2 Tax=Periophthalmus magnuspinnatus TaxID=409849 RepID=UPI00145AE45C|nr:eukaryotic translation elongation factor 1 delta a (guanine nucleotide exchange protein) isoform X3 [Periophthalmus magnuspinnatus]